MTEVWLMSWVHCCGWCGPASGLLSALIRCCLLSGPKCRSSKATHNMMPKNFWGELLIGKLSYTWLMVSTAVWICTRSSATAEKQRISCTCLPRLANWSCNAQNTAESQRLYYFWHSNALIQELLAENAFCHEIAAQGHSRSFTLQSFARRQGGSISSHICEVFEDV